MPDAHLLNDIAIALALAFAGGFVARLIGIPAIVGYLLAGIFISPFTPGYSGDIETLRLLAELGVIFLMFGVGLHFNLSDLSQVRGIVIPGAIAQMIATALIGWGIGAGAGLDAREHRREAARIVEVPFDARRAGALHPLQVGAGAEVLAGAGQHDHAHRVVGFQLREGGVDLADHRLVEGIEDGLAGHRHLGHAGGAGFDAQGVHAAADQ